MVEVTANNVGRAAKVNHKQAGHYAKNLRNGGSAVLGNHAAKPGTDEGSEQVAETWLQPVIETAAGGERKQTNERSSQTEHQKGGERDERQLGTESVAQQNGAGSQSVVAGVVDLLRGLGQNARRRDFFENFLLPVGG